MCNSKSIHTTLSPVMFWESVNILINKPHVINKRLWGSKIWFRHACKPNISAWSLPTFCSKLEKEVTVENVENLAKKISDELNITICTESDVDVEVILLELLPKTYTSKRGFQLICLHKRKSTVNFYNVSPGSYEECVCPDFPYGVQLQDNVITLTAQCDDTCKSYVWLINTLLPQFIKWGTESENNNKSNVICNESLALVCKDGYYEKYNYLKLKYGKEMVKIWPECTDPSKFVYEDVAIAAYLLLLWEADGISKKKFVDLGCGNGLLVYILIQEGHDGLGLDVRKRQIWDMYPANIKLQEKIIIPSDVSIFPETDWIIGNHSDELTPWIPVIAARSSYKCNFFLLPCCAYNFDGTKYQRKNSFKSQYFDYLEHIKELCEECGFKVATDRLKIPSTKRICLVGRGRTYADQEQSQYCNKIQQLINRDTTDNKQENESWVKDFKARDPVEKVRNCTQLDQNLIESIVNNISKYLLDGCSTESNWSIGRTVEFNELVKLIPQNELNQLKSECGGIQTLLKNNHNIFIVQDGKVQLRYPKTVEEVSKNHKKKKQNASNIKIQQKPCWFFTNHPQGCPLNDTDCSFLHVKS